MCFYNNKCLRFIESKFCGNSHWQSRWRDAPPIFYFRQSGRAIRGSHSKTIFIFWITAINLSQCRLPWCISRLVSQCSSTPTWLLCHLLWQLYRIGFHPCGHPSWLARNYVTSLMDIPRGRMRLATGTDYRWSTLISRWASLIWCHRLFRYYAYIYYL